MGAKSSNNFQSDRPESGGADKDMSREKSGLLDREKEHFATEQAKRAESVPRGDNEPAAMDGEPSDDPNPESRNR